MEQAEELQLSRDPAKSKFDVDNSEDGDSENDHIESKVSLRQNSDNGHEEGHQRKSRFEEIPPVKQPLSEPVEEPVARSKEEILAEMSSQLKMLLTSTLLEVTDEEVHQISSDVLERCKTKALPRPGLAAPQ